MVHPSRPPFLLSYLSPRFAGTWCVIGLLYLLSLLPFALHRPLGRLLGRIARAAVPKREHIARTNLERCFPDWSKEKREELLDRHFDEMGRAVLDTATAWFWPDWRAKGHIAEVKGLEHLKNAIEQNANILVIAPHFYTIEWHTRLFGVVHPGVGIYRPNSNPLYEYWQHKGRTRDNKYLVDRHDIRGMLKALKDKLPVWYAPDHDYGGKASVFVPFFAEPHASTVTGTATLARLKNTQVIPSYAARTAKGYQLVILPPLEGFPCGDEITDATSTNRAIESMVAEHPALYMWIHRRFKTRPTGEKTVY